MPKFILASDIDNTLTTKSQPLPDPVVAYLTELYEEGIEIVFMTGRVFTFAETCFRAIKFPYHLVLQNGAEVVRMPEKKLIETNYLDKDFLRWLESFHDDFIIYSGLERGDYCYFKPGVASEFALLFFEKIKSIVKLPWQSFETLDDIEQDKFPMIKCISPDKKVMQALEKEIHQHADVETALMTDVVDTKLSILLITAKGVDKGSALSQIKRDYSWTCPVIAAGDDNNDYTLLKSADARIIMPDATDKVMSLGGIMADSAENHGIINGIRQARSSLNI